MKELKEYMSKMMKIHKLRENIDELQSAFNELTNFSAEEILNEGDEFIFKYESLNVVYDAIKLNMSLLLAETDKLRVLLPAERLFVKKVREKDRAKAVAILEAREIYCQAATKTERKFENLTETKTLVEMQISTAYQSSQKGA